MTNVSTTWDSSLDPKDDYRSGSFSEDYPHPDDHTRKTTDAPGFKLFSTPVSYWTWVRCWEAWRRLAHVFKLNATFVASCWLVPSSNVGFLPNANTFKHLFFIFFISRLKQALVLWNLVFLWLQTRESSFEDSFCTCEQLSELNRILET